MKSSDLKFEIAHVLFIDIVGYSKLLINEQSQQLETLKAVVRSTEQFRLAEAEGKLLRLPTGDGGALVFRNSPEAPVTCAMEIGKALKNHPELRVRMGIHSGPVNEVTDLNEQANIAGAGINIAQRVMDCGDAGHILLSKRVADDLEQYPQWRSLLHDLGECEVKHGMRVSLVNLYTPDAGNAALPTRLAAAKEAPLESKHRLTSFKAVLAILVLLGCLGVLALVFIPAILKSLRSPTLTEKPATASASSLIPEKSIAVLPFENFSESKENEFFADGVQDDILTALSKVADLKVISRTSVMTYAAGAKRNLREIAQALGVSHILEGSVRRADGKVRVTAQLIDARSDAHMWADTYDRDLADVFAIQSEIAKTIAAQLQAKLSPPEKAALEEQPTNDLAAHDLYVRAKFLNEASSFDSRRRNKLLQAADLLNQAVERDPKFFLAYCLLANTQALLYFYGEDHTPERRASVEAAVESAAQVRPEAGETHLARADYRYRCYLDYEGARAELALAQKLLPNNAQVFTLLGYIDRRQSRYDESTRNLERALELDPRNWFYLQQLSLTYQFLRRYPEMAAVLDRVVTILPGDLNTKIARASVDMDWKADTGPLRQSFDAALAEDPNAGTGSAQAYMLLAFYERNPEAIERAIAAAPPTGVGFDQVVLPRGFWKGLRARMQGDSATAHEAFADARQEIEKLLKEQPDYAPALCSLGIIDAGLGDKEKAISEGRRARELLPVEKDNVNGAHMSEFLALIYAWAGEKELALQELNTAVHHPGIISFGQLRLSPIWDPLRGDPRFEKIVASLAPKEK
ncbi:MAG TPA: adenylate/guanylate cyclase domain-containing protein [Chthoniobacterales bacterium]|jgi:TolB-like protein/class 3 adenylate cyclase/Flp pilus assembly protein TadD